MALLQTKIEAPTVEPLLAARNSVRLRRLKASPQQLDAEIGLVSIATDRSALQPLDAFVYLYVFVLVEGVHERYEKVHS